MIPPSFTCQPDTRRGATIQTLIKAAQGPWSSNIIASALVGAVDRCNYHAYHQVHLGGSYGSEELAWMVNGYWFVDIADMLALDSTNTPEEVLCC